MKNPLGDFRVFCSDCPEKTAEKYPRKSLPNSTVNHTGKPLPKSLGITQNREVLFGQFGHLLTVELRGHPG